MEKYHATHQIVDCRSALPARLIELGGIFVVNSRKMPGSSFEAWK
jgi:hypothetical protein